MYNFIINFCLSLHSRVRQSPCKALVHCYVSTLFNLMLFFFSMLKRFQACFVNGTHLPALQIRIQLWRSTHFLRCMMHSLLFEVKHISFSFPQKTSGINLMAFQSFKWVLVGLMAWCIWASALSGQTQTFQID